MSRRSLGTTQQEEEGGAVNDLFRYNSAQGSGGYEHTSHVHAAGDAGTQYQQQEEEEEEHLTLHDVSGGGSNSDSDDAWAALYADLMQQMEARELEAVRDAELLALEKVQKAHAALQARLAALLGDNDAEEDEVEGNHTSSTTKDRSCDYGTTSTTTTTGPAPSTAPPSLRWLRREVARRQGRRRLQQAVHRAAIVDAKCNVVHLLTAARLREVMRIFLFYPISVQRGVLRGPATATTTTTTTNSIGSSSTRSSNSNSGDRGTADGIVSEADRDRVAQLSGVCSIAGIPLPASGDCTGVMPEVVCTVLGSAAHLLDAVCAVLNVLPPHPVRPFHSPECAAVGVFRNGDLTFLNLSPLLYGDESSRKSRTGNDTSSYHQAPGASAPAHAHVPPGAPKHPAHIVSPNPEFKLAVTLLGADAIYLCLQLGISPSSLFPEPAVLLNLHVLYRHLLQRAQSYRHIMRSIPADLSERALQEYYSRAVAKLFPPASPDPSSGASPYEVSGGRLPPIPEACDLSDVSRAIALALTERYSALAAEGLRAASRAAAEVEDTTSDWLLV